MTARSNNLSGFSDHTKVCIYTPEYIKDLYDAIYYPFASKYQVDTHILMNIYFISRHIHDLNLVMTKRFDHVESPSMHKENYNSSSEYTSLITKFRDIKRLNALVDKYKNIILNALFEQMDATEKFELMEKLEKIRKIHCIQNMKEQNNINLNTKFKGGKRKTRHRRSKRKTRTRR